MRSSLFTRSEVVVPLLFLIVACVLLVLNRYTNEGFEVSNNNNIPCGVDLPSCSPETHCFNGFCGSTVPSKLPHSSGLPVLPIGKSY